MICHCCGKTIEEAGLCFICDLILTLKYKDITNEDLKHIIKICEERLKNG